MKKKKKSFLNLMFSVDQFKDEFNKNKKFYKDLRDEEKKKNFNESFEDAIIRLNLSEEDLSQKKLNFKKNSRFFYLLSLFFLLLSLFLSFTNIGANFQTIFVLPVISLYMALLGFRFAFNKYQIEERDLKSLKKFIKEPKKWI